MKNISLKKKYLLKENYNFLLYQRFISSEIPNIIQIITLLGFLSFLLKVPYLRLLLPLLVVGLTASYLVSKGNLYLINQITSEFSELNLKKLDYELFLKKWKKYSVVSAFIFGFIVSLLTECLTL